MTAHATRADLSVAEPIAAFAEESLDRHGIDRAAFWAGVSGLVHELAPRNAELLRARDDLQTRIDDYHRAAPGTPDPAAYRAFLTEIGYLRPEPASVAASTADVAPEIARLAGPQLVVPILNARFALNAANARWGSLYDALYGTDAIPREGDLAPGSSFNTTRAAAVIARGRGLLDTVAPLASGSHAGSTGYAVRDGALAVASADQVAQIAGALALDEALVEHPEIVVDLGEILVAAVADQRHHPLGLLLRSAPPQCGGQQSSGRGAAQNPFLQQ